MQNLNNLSALYIQAKRLAETSPLETDPSNHQFKTNTPKNYNAKYRSIFISDVHLGTKDCKAAQLNDFLKHHSCEQLYLVGDIFDGWRMQSGVYWHKSFNRIIRRILKLAKKGIPIYYITGNHDEFLRRYANTQLDNIYLINRKIHITANKLRFLIIHGDQFEQVTRCTKLLKYIGDRGYDWLMLINRICNRLRAKYGYGYWSFAAFLKEHIKRAKQYIDDYECAVAHGAKKQGFDGVICGHIHQAADKNIEGVRYLNTGDWVESCTAIVEDFEGELKLVHWLDDFEQNEGLARSRKLKLNKEIDKTPSPALT